jgi:hypothetical protein
MKFLRTNLKFMREEMSLKQSDIPGFSGSKWGNYELGTSVPGLKDFTVISNYFGVDEHSLLHLDLRVEGNLNYGRDLFKNTKKGNLKGKLIGKPIIKKHPETDNSPFIEKQPDTAYVSSSIMPKVITIDTQGNENVLLVHVKARAGYLNGYSDPEFMASLPAYRLPGLNNGTFRLFEVDGLSMYPTLHGGDLVICSNVEQLGIVRDDRVHVVVTKNEGVVVKRVLNRMKADGKLILKSDNYKDRDMYPPIVCQAHDVLEVWYVTGYISRQLKAPAEIYNRLIDLEGRFTLLEEKIKKTGK